MRFRKRSGGKAPEGFMGLEVTRAMRNRWLRRTVMSSSQTAVPLDEIMHSAEQLPPFPNVVQKVMPLLKRMAPVEDIEAVIRFDPAIAARVIALSRSPFYARRATVHSLRDAIISLGQRQLVQVILAACAARFQADNVESYDLRAGELWEHAVATAIMADRLAEELGHEERLTLYTAGLLHDIGKTILNHRMKDYFDAIFSAVRQERMHFLEAERRVLGIDHQELGAVICRRWRFPERVVAGIGYHHRPSDAGRHRDVASILYAANRMVCAMGIGAGVDGFLNPNEDKVFEALRISGPVIDRLMAEVFTILDETRQFLAS